MHSEFTSYRESLAVDVVPDVTASARREAELIPADTKSQDTSAAANESSPQTRRAYCKRQGRSLGKSWYHVATGDQASAFQTQRVTLAGWPGSTGQPSAPTSLLCPRASSAALAESWCCLQSAWWLLAFQNNA